MFNGREGAKRLRRGAHVVDAKEVGAAEVTLNDAGDGAGVALGWDGQPEHIADHGLARYREEDRALEVREAIELPVDGQVVGALFGEVDAGIKNDGVARDAGGFGQRDFLGKEAVESGHDIVVTHVGVRDFGFADGMHDQQPGSGVGADASVVIGRQRADVVEQIAAARQDGADDAGTAAGGAGHGEGRRAGRAASYPANTRSARTSTAARVAARTS